MASRRSMPPPASGDPFADAVRQANLEFRAAIDEEGAFANLSRRLAARDARAGWVRMTWPALAALAVVGLIALRRPQPALRISPELLVSAERPRPVPPGRTLAVSAERARPALAAPRSASSAAEPAATRRELVPARSLSARRLPPSSPAPALAASAEPTSSDAAAKSEVETTNSDAVVAPDCLRLARQGATRDAEQCFVGRAQGGGLSAEMALYELSRLRRDVLGDAPGALAALDDYGARFPTGSLRREVDMSYLELLVQLGRNREALARSQALLAMPSGRERAAELHLLRGDVFRRSLKDLRAAEREYAEAEQLAGSVEAEATYLRGVCLEALGQPVAAREAFQRYLSKPARPRAAEVQRRLERLSP
jgi:hypothetical protein